jgi:hypothetical protein
MAILARTPYGPIELLNVDANPSGSITAATGSLAVLYSIGSDNGNIYKNAGGNMWTLFLSGSSSGVPVQNPTPEYPSKLLGSVYAETGVFGGEFGTTITGSIPNDDTIPQFTEGAVILTSPTYTVKSSTSKIRVTAYSGATSTTGGSLFCIHTHRSDNGGSYTANAEGSSFSSITGASFGAQVNLAYQVSSPGSGATITYKLMAGPSAGTLSVNGSLGARYFGGKFLTTLLIQEIES